MSGQRFMAGELEQAVINAALRELHHPALKHSMPDLYTAVSRLTYDCDECNYGRHQCSGCGASVEHAGTGVCADCMEGIESNPPIVPNPEAESRMAAALDGCTCDRAQRVYCQAENCQGGADVPEWQLRTWQDVRPGDTVRLPGTEHTARVLTVLPVQHLTAPGGNPRYPRAQRWQSITITLDAVNSGSLHMDPAGAVEILLSPGEVAAIEALGGWSERVRMEQS